MALEAKMTKEAALEILCLACTTLVTDGKIVYGSKLAGELAKAPRCLARSSTSQAGSNWRRCACRDESRHRDEAVTASSPSRTQYNAPERTGPMMRGHGEWNAKAHQRAYAEGA